MEPPRSFNNGSASFATIKAPLKFTLITSSNSSFVVFSREFNPCMKPARLTKPDNDLNPAKAFEILRWSLRSIFLVSIPFFGGCFINDFSKSITVTSQPSSNALTAKDRPIPPAPPTRTKFFIAFKPQVILMLSSLNYKEF